MFGKRIGVAVLGAAMLFGLTISGAAAVGHQAAVQSSDCVVHDQQPDGTVVRRTVPEGATVDLPTGGRLTCVDGSWVTTVAGRSARIPEITIEDNVVTFDKAALDGGADISMSQTADIVRGLFGVESGVDRVVVTADDGRELTDEQVMRLLEDPTSGVAPVLRVVDFPAADVTFEHIAREVGDGQPTVIYAGKKPNSTPPPPKPKAPAKVTVECSAPCKVTVVVERR